jgi:hypothetical protein
MAAASGGAIGLGKDFAAAWPTALDSARAVKKAPDPLFFLSGREVLE